MLRIVTVTRSIIGQQKAMTRRHPKNDDRVLRQSSLSLLLFSLPILTLLITTTHIMFYKRRKQLSNRPRGAKRQRKRHARPLLVCLLAILFVSSILCIIAMLFMFGMTRKDVTHSDNTSSSSSDGHLRRTAKDDENKEDESLEEKSFSLIHIVNTRFMQEQGHLYTLAMARLHLFETFCLPSMIHQTSQDFLWIVKTDPKLDERVKSQLVELLKPYPHFYLVGSNNNFGTEGGSWRDGSEGTDILESDTRKVYTGHVEWLQQAHALRENRPILETRLDADDGIHKLFLQYVQYSASKLLYKKKWLYWCSRRHVEWYASPKKEEGLVNPVQHSQLCITPGITVGYNINVSEVPQYDHDVLYKAIQAHGGCHENESTVGKEEENMDCIQLVDDLSFVAVRSRTPTSAGMMNVDLEKEILDKERRELMWKALDKLFFVSRDRAVETNQFVLENLPQIAKENLEGQCTKGHSCKNSSVVLLQKLIEKGEKVSSE